MPGKHKWIRFSSTAGGGVVFEAVKCSICGYIKSRRRRRLQKRAH